MFIKLILFLFLFIYTIANTENNNDFYAKINQIKNYFFEYGSLDIPAYLIENNHKKNLLVIGRAMDTKMGEIVILKRLSDNGSGQIILPLKDGGFHLKWIVPDAYKKAITYVKQSKIPQAITLIRPHIYPLIQYLDINNEVFDIQHPILFFLKILIENEQWEEAFFILSKISYKKVNPIYQNFLFKVSEQFITLRQPTLAIQLFEKVFTQNANLQLQDKMMDFLYLLMLNGYPKKSSYLYDKIIKIHDFHFIIECRLWQAYCHLKMKQPELTRMSIDKLGKIPSNKKEFSLYLFILSQLDTLEEHFEDAITKLSRAIIYAPKDSRWVPELMYTTGYVYQELGNIEASNSIHKKVTLFFPKSFWAIKSHQIISEKIP